MPPKATRTAIKPQHEVRAGCALEPVSIIERPCNADLMDAALAHGYTALQASIIARRLPASAVDALQRHVRPEIRDLDPPDLLPDIVVAAQRIGRAVIMQEPIACVVDHDADGVSSLSVIFGALVDALGVDPGLIRVYSSHRLREGYGISDALVDRMLADGFTAGLVITADHGSADEPRIARLRAAGIDTVVTDHHGIEGKGPPSAVACVNPCREDSVFPDRFIAGCHVAWLVMAEVRRRLIKCGHISESAPKLGFLLAYVALGTTADCVSFARSRNNRLIVQHGLHQMNTRPAPCWTALREIKGVAGPITTETLGFIFGPMINAGGRLDDAMPGFQLLRSTDLQEALAMAERLNQANEERKSIERAMREEAEKLADEQVSAGARGICVWLSDGHAGIHGVSASRLVQTLGRPVLCLSPKQGEPGIVTGSARAVPGFDVRAAFARIAEREPDLLEKWGGHEGAGGLRLAEADISRLQAAWDLAVKECESARIGPCFVTDGALPARPSMALLTELAALEPYGREFDAPVFAQEAWLSSARRVGEGGKHMQVTLVLNDEAVKGIWFSVPNLDWTPCIGDRVRVVFTLSTNTYRGSTTLQLLVQHMEPCVPAQGSATSGSATPSTP